MPDLRLFKPQGMLHEGWIAQVGDYALTCGWLFNGNALLVEDVSGGLYSFDGSTVAINWQAKELHQEGLLAMTIHPYQNLFATVGQDGCLQIWSSETYEVIHTINLGCGWVEYRSWSPDGSYLAVSMSRHVYAFDINARDHWRSEEHSSAVSANAW